MGSSDVSAQEAIAPKLKFAINETNVARLQACLRQYTRRMYSTGSLVELDGHSLSLQARGNRSYEPSQHLRSFWEAWARMQARFEAEPMKVTDYGNVAKFGPVD